jgi:hypothetical protein
MIVTSSFFGAFTHVVTTSSSFGSMKTGFLKLHHLYIPLILHIGMLIYCEIAINGSILITVPKLYFILLLI